MTKVIPRVVVAWMALGFAMSAAEVLDLSGMWQLNVQKSKWGGKRKPTSVVVQIDHKEPVLRYTGTVIDANSEDRHFEFNGSIDGKEYPATTEFGDGKVTVKRASPYVLTFSFKSNDGRYQETWRTILSRDGKQLTQEMRLKGPDRSLSWSELYEKR